MSDYINKGDKVCWQTGQQQVNGLVVDTYNQQISGNVNHSEYMPARSGVRKALLIELEDGRKVLKLEDEVNRMR